MMDRIDGMQSSPLAHDSMQSVSGHVRRLTPPLKVPRELHCGDVKVQFPGRPSPQFHSNRDN
ncbi:MAG: hypothetical protein AMXMBFR4_19030 [Candidatus Hydrogenedentota bacterium]